MTGCKNLTPFVKGNQYGKANKHQNAFDTLAFKGALLGQTNEEIASMLEISVSTFYNWMKKIPTFLEAVQGGKIRADAEVASALYLSAVGRTVSKEVVVKQQAIDSHTGKLVGYSEEVVLPREIPGNVRAQIQWLANRRPKQWAPHQKDVPTRDSPTNVNENINAENIVRKQTEELEAIFGEIITASDTKDPPTSL